MDCEMKKKIVSPYTDDDGTHNDDDEVSAQRMNTHDPRRALDDDDQNTLADANAENGTRSVFERVHSRMMIMLYWCVAYGRRWRSNRVLKDEVV